MPSFHSPGDEVLIGDGPFVGRIATIGEVKDETAIVTLFVFDRVVPLELGLSQLLPPPESGDGIRDPRPPNMPVGCPRFHCSPGVAPEALPPDWRRRIFVLPCIPPGSAQDCTRRAT
jgi:hypothetical protein